MIFCGVMTGNNVSTVRVLIMKRRCMQFFKSDYYIFDSGINDIRCFCGIDGTVFPDPRDIFCGDGALYFMFLSVDLQIVSETTRAVHVFGQPEPVLVFFYYLALAVFIFIMCSGKYEKSIKTGGLIEVLFAEYLSYASHAWRYILNRIFISECRM